MSAIAETVEVKEVKETNEAAVGDVDMKEPVFSLDEAVGDEIVTLLSADNVKFEATKKQAILSKLVSATLENDIAATEIPVPGAKGVILAHVIEYMKHHNGVPEAIIEKPLKSKIMKDVCSDKWDAEFIDGIGADRQPLYDLILAANYMDIKCLLYLGCAKVASMIKGQPLEKIKDILAVDQTASKKAETETTALTTALAGTSIADTSSSSTDPVTIHSSSETKTP
jgi:hypothetical protein